MGKKPGENRIRIKFFMLARKTPLLISLALLACLTSCKKGNKVTPVMPGKSLVLSAYEQQKATADNAFSIRLFKKLDSAGTPGNNLVVSPLSVSFALGMTSNGAAGTTWDAFKNTLGFEGLSQQQVNEYSLNLITNLPQLDPNASLEIANSIWYKQGFSVLPAFLQANKNYFKAQVQALDFTSPSAVGTINNWVSDNTKGKIPAIINQIPDNAVMYLINAVYFKSSWNEKFDPNQTKQGSFYLDNGSSVQAQLMSGMISMNSYAGNNAMVYELPYSGKKYSMVIAMPADRTMPIATFINNLDSASWQTWMAGLQPEKYNIIMPKFKFSYEKLLNDPLSQLGLGIAFTDKADFSLISPSSKLQISQVIHKAFIETDENGSTAAAATSVGVVVTSAPVWQAVINRPFVFAIREMNTGLILFMGVVNNPNLAGS